MGTIHGQHQKLIRPVQTLIANINAGFGHNAVPGHAERIVKAHKPCFVWRKTCGGSQWNPNYRFLADSRHVTDERNADNRGGHRS